MNRIFIVPIHVLPLEGSIMPSGLKGAYVKCYAAGPHYVEAVKRALRQLAEDHIHPEKILEPIQEVEIDVWDEHVREAWGDYASHFPSKGEMDKKRTAGEVIYSPFYSYERDAPSK